MVIQKPLTQRRVSPPLSDGPFWIVRSDKDILLVRLN